MASIPPVASSGAPEPALSPSRILSLAASCLDKDAPQLNNAWEAVALVGHACMTAVDFRLIGLGEGHSLSMSYEISKVLNGQVC